MTTTVSIHQPNYLLFPGTLRKLLSCQIFVFLDNVQMPLGRSFRSRNRIKTKDGERWLTVPVQRKGVQNISDVLIDNSRDWQIKHWKTIEQSYGKAQYFAEWEPILRPFYRIGWTRLADLDMMMTKELAAEILKGRGTLPEFRVASQLPVEGSSTDLLISICKAVGGGVYLSGPSGHDYMDEEKFKKAGIELRYSDYKAVPYRQLWGEFIPNLSVIDLLMNEGGGSLDIIKPPDLIEDGFGSAAPAICPECGRRSVYVCRPGDFRCSVCYDGNPKSQYECNND